MITVTLAGDIWHHFNGLVADWTNDAPNPNVSAGFDGIGLTYGAQGEITGGTITGVWLEDVGAATRVLDIAGLSIDAVAFLDADVLPGEDVALSLLPGAFASAVWQVSGTGAKDTIRSHTLLPGSVGIEADLGDGDDWSSTGSGNDRIWLGDGNDWSEAGAGHDVIYAGLGRDRLGGGDGHDTLLAGAGNDWVYGHDGRDDLQGQKGDDTLSSGSGDDTLDGGLGDDQLSGDRGDDVLRGRNGDDFLDGGKGNDSLGGGQGNDTLTGGWGSDVLWGRDGEDEFLFRSGNGSDTIGDFDASEDHIRLASNLFDGPKPDAAEVILLYAEQLGTSVQFEFANGDRLLVRGDQPVLLADVEAALLL